MSWSRRRRPDPDGILRAQLNGAAHRLASEGAPDEAAHAELAELANGRGDLLAEAGGVLLGYAREDPLAVWTSRRAADFLIGAGADKQALPHWIEVGRQRAQRPRPSCLTPKNTTRTTWRHRPQRCCRATMEGACGHLL